MGGTAVRDSLSELSALIASERPYVHTAVVACGGSDTVDVGQIDYVARRSGHDTEECVREAVKAGEIVPFHMDPYGYREFDIYYVTPKGRREHRKHMRRVYRDSEEFVEWSKKNSAEFDVTAAAGEDRQRQPAGGDPAAPAGREAEPTG